MNDSASKKSLIDQIDYKQILSLLWMNKKFISIFTSLAALLSILYSLSITNIYVSQTLLAPTTSTGTPSLNSEYSNLATMAGINLPKGGNEKQINIALNLVKSKKLMIKLMEYESFLPDLLAAKKWDIKTNTITYDRALYDAKNKNWVRKVSLPYKKIPSAQEALIEFSELVSVSQDKRTELIILEVSHLSPTVARQWAIWIVEEINTILANMQINNSQASIDYLNSQVKVTPYNELKTMFYQLIQESTQSMMLAKVNPEYVLTTIDPPVIPETKSQPRRTLIIIFGMLLGLMFSIAIIIIRKYGLNKETELKIFGS